MKQTMMNTAAGVLAAVLLGSAGLAWAQPTPAQIQQQQFQRQQNELGMYYQQQQNNRRAAPRGPTAAEIRAWEQREAEVQAEIAELRRTPFYMAVAYDFGTFEIMWAGGYYSERRAVERSLAQCKTSNCRVFATFSNACAVVTRPDRGARSTEDLFVGIDTDDSRAAAKSIQACEARHGQGQCSYLNPRTKNGMAFCTGYDYSIYGHR
ncbi:hypothetical protein A7Q02_05035 [Eikenella sp. NML97-A-109]|uniref:DUF4189 domain-containing protein n=1 Tax=Eikenella sp. NML97-A-109 TaxID=1795833 RepID=UPI0007E0EDDB|nr:DUF4189 domain-containing protein [Eikenella sp. NML97-A-109]OAM42051.1 hypothetical protein A7Q02_05035 [Eikenella sp. NML97-A-109]